ncbi:hypothetical protein B0H13DRAFT_2371777 [Mycena leptocephala]|nr:hypothetical protein B0H13DRAFT_2371777 [Mycena leptocephala]
MADQVIRKVQNVRASDTTNDEALSHDDIRSSGVCGAGHERVRPNGIGDLQKGERYTSIDYAPIDLDLTLLMISYDIACQWTQNTTFKWVLTTFRGLT